MYFESLRTNIIISAILVFTMLCNHFSRFLNSFNFIFTSTWRLKSHIFCLLTRHNLHELSSFSVKEKYKASINLSFADFAQKVRSMILNLILMINLGEELLTFEHS